MLIALNLDYGQDLMYDNKFETFVLTVLHQPIEKIDYKKECLWVLSNILGGPSVHNFEIILDNKNLLCLIVEHAFALDISIKQEALVVLYNLCANHDHKYMNKVIN